MGTRRIGTVCAAVTLCLAASACGDDDSDDSTSATAAQQTAAAQPATSAASSASMTATTATTSTGATDAAPTDDMDAPVIPVGANPQGLGQDPDNPSLFHGSGGFTLDTSDCPSDWANDEGITDSEIRLFTALPLSGPIAQVGGYGQGIRSYFDYVNSKGGIDGREITLDLNDNQYQPDLTVTAVEQALQTGQYAASVGINGTPHNLAIWDDMNNECVPQVLTGAGSAEWGDVNGHPWTTPGYTLTYVAESRVQVEWLKDRFPQGAKIATLTINNDFGKQYLVGTEKAVEGTNLEVVATEYHDPAAPNLTNQFTTLAGTNADVLVLQTSGTFCTQSLANWERSAWKPLIFLPNGCIGAATVNPLIEQGLTGAGAFIVQNFTDIADPSVANVPFVEAYNEFLPTQDMDPKNTAFSLGWGLGWAMTQIIADASTYEGGLNRANIVLAARAFDHRIPLLLPGLTTKVNGTEDAYLQEGGQVVEYTVADPKAFGVYTPVGDVVNFEGQLGTWDTFKSAIGG